MFLIPGTKYQNKSTGLVYELKQDYNGWYLVPAHSGKRSKAMSIPSQEMRLTLQVHYKLVGE